MGNPEALIEQARAVLAGNDMGAFVRPGRDLYPHQWNWDSALIAIGLARVDPARARAEVRSLLRGQWRDGMVPHIVFHVPNPDYSPGPELWGSAACEGAPDVATSGITQPPVLATAVRVLHEADPDPGVPRGGRPGARAVAPVAARDARERGGARRDPAPVGGGRQLASLRRGAGESRGRRVDRDRAHGPARGRRPTSGRRPATTCATGISSSISASADTGPSRSRASRSSSST